MHKLTSSHQNEVFNKTPLSRFVIAQEIEAEGRSAIESPTSPMIPVLGPEGYQLGK
jgi:hypothetical protein